MKEDTAVKKKRKNKKRIVMIISAAAVLMSLGAIGAGAYYEGYRLEDGQIIKKFGGEGAEEWLESKGLNEKQSDENGHFDISMSSFISDGNYCQAFWCIEALDEAAEEQLDNDIASPLVKAYYADTGEEISMAGSSAPFDTSLNDATHFYFSQKMPIKNVDVSRDIEFRIVTAAAYINDAENLADGLKFVVNASPNVETKILANEKGTELLLSPLGLSQQFGEGEEYPDKITDWALIKSDGAFETFEDWGYGRSGDSTVMWSLYFFKILDISDIDGIKINDDIYTDINKSEENIP